MLGRLLVCLLLLGGCVSQQPTGKGFHTDIPASNAALIVWGNHPAATAAATTWLLHQNIGVIEHTKVQQLLADGPQPGSPMLQDTVVLDAAKRLGAKTVVFVTQSGDVRAPMVSVRGVDVESTRILWSGYARYPEYVKRPFSDLLVTLTCHAMAMAWGRECGEKDRACC